MKFDIKPERYNEFKKYMAKKLTKEKGKKYLAKDIFVGEKLNENNYKLNFLSKLNHYKYIIGDANFRFYDDLTLSDVEFIYGEANFSNSIITDLDKLEIIGGNVIFRSSKITNLNNLKFIGGDADFFGTSISNLGKIEYVGGELNLEDSKVENIDSLRYVGGEILLDEYQKVLFKDKIYPKGKSYYFKNDTEYMKEKNIVEENENLL